jgi:hypothetical protein
VTGILPVANGGTGWSNIAVGGACARKRYRRSRNNQRGHRRTSARLGRRNADVGRNDDRPQCQRCKCLQGSLL